MVRFSRMTLLIIQAFVAVTALAGGLALMIGSIDPDLASVLIPPGDYLEGSPFRSYLVPGLLLIVLVAGVHAIAFVAVLTESRWKTMFSAAGGFACAIWIFVQMVYIPFSFLQALYFVIGLAELGLTMVMLGILDEVTAAHRSTFVPARSRRAPHAHG
ncbi:hypothetical protein [Microbacterium atlanticum]|uniref:hypothetical protein n=1 Tax=Microbacterium atlanticum TaxID=2782168 RepID=UPI001889973A|nr:hypothetical protein [Microbacterium atlanticum]